MKVFISADIEGTCGICTWNETEKSHSYSDYFLNQMSLEVSNAALGALESGATKILVKDSHDTALNINPLLLPKEVLLHRGWSQDIFCMMSGIQDEKWDAVAFTGYHSPAFSNTNPLAHTMSTHIEEVTINGKITSEFMINAYTAGYFNIPVVFVSGDFYLCSLAKELIPNITTVSTNIGVGNGVTSIHPQVACEQIQKGVKESLSKKDLCFVDMPKEFNVTVRYKEHKDAYRNSAYKDAFSMNTKTIGYNNKDYLEILRFFHFVL